MYMGHEIGRSEINTLVRKPEGKRRLGQPRRRWKDNIKIGLKETGYEGVDWIHLALYTVQQRALVNTVTSSRLHKMMVCFLNS
jgi:hypothetical protein